MPTGHDSARRCPRCGIRVAQQAQTCILCGSRLSSGNYVVPLAVLVAVAVLGGILVAAWRDQAGRPRDASAAGLPTGQPTATALAMAPTTEALAAPAATLTATTEPTPSPLENTPTETPEPEPTPTETPVPTPTEEPTATPTPGPTVHVVRSGDVLGTIANHYGVSVDDILAANPGLTERTILKIGQEILIPERTQSSAETAEPTSAPQYFIHVIESGDTLLYLANKYDVTVAEILAANDGLTERSILSLGQEVHIPVKVPSGGPEEQENSDAESTAEGDTTAAAEGTPQAAGKAGPLATPTSSLLSMGGPAQPRALEPLSPRDGAKVRVGEVMLNWTGVGELAPDLWYVVHLWPVGKPDDMISGHTKSNSWRPTEDLIARWGASAHLYWDVGIGRDIGTGGKDAPVFEPAGPRTEPQDFYVLPPG